MENIEMLDEPTPQHLYDLLLVGLMWTRREESINLADLGETTLYALLDAGAFPDDTPLDEMRNRLLVDLIRENTVYSHGAKYPRRNVLLDLIRTSTTHLLTQVQSDPFDDAEMLGPKGYGLVITNVGMAYARAIYPTYAQHVVRDDFIRWRQEYLYQKRRGVPEPLLQSDKAIRTLDVTL